MALITCPECKREVSDLAASCPNCGFPFYCQDDEEQAILITVNVVKVFLISPQITIRLNGEEVAWIGNGQSESFYAYPGKNTLFLSAGIRSKVVEFTAYQDVYITVSWDMLLGGIKVLCIGPDEYEVF